MPLPVAPAIPGIPAGYGPVQADMDAWVTTPFSFLATPVAFRGSLAGGQSISAGGTFAHLDTISEDPYGGWSATATGSQAAFSWLCPAGCSGFYEVTLTSFTGSQTPPQVIAARLVVSGVLWTEGARSEAGSAGTNGCSGWSEVPLLGGVDYVQLFIYSSGAVSVPTSTGQLPTMEIAWVSA